MAKRKIRINKNKKGTFTKAAKKRGMGVQEFADKVMANKNMYSDAMVKKANFARNSTKFKHANGGEVSEESPYSRFKTMTPSQILETVRDEGLPVEQLQQLTEYLSSENYGYIPELNIGESKGTLGFHDPVVDYGETLLGKPNQKFPDQVDNEYYPYGKTSKKSISKSPYIRTASGETRRVSKKEYEQYKKDIEAGKTVKFPITEEAESYNKLPEFFLGGAISGASAGAALGPWGIAGGAILGGAAELIGSNKAKKQQEEMLKKQQAMQTSQAAARQRLSSMEATPQYAPTFQKGGEVNSSNNTETNYLKNLDLINETLFKNVVYDTDLPDSTRRNALRAQKDLKKEIPMSMREVIDDSNINEMRYFNNLVDRVGSSLTEENIETAVSGNSLGNIYRKGKLLRNSGMYKADLDSLQKYTPDFYEKYNLKYAAPLLPDGEIPEYAQGGKTRNMNKKYQIGGMPEMPNAELEGGESIELPNGEGMPVNGPSHAQGGVDMNLPEGTEIYSDRLKVPGTSKTFSEANKDILKKMKKYEDTLDSPKATSLATRTAERMLAKLEAEQDKLFQTQQQLNGDSTGQQSEFQDGGISTSLAPMQLRDTSGMNQYRPGMFGKLSAAIGGTNLGGILGTAASLAPVISNIGQGLFGKAEQLNPEQFQNPYESSAIRRMENRRYDVAPELEAARNAGNVARYNTRNAARTRGELLSSYAPISTAETRAASQAYARKQNTENQYAAQTASMEAGLGQQRAATNLRIEDINQRSRAAKSNMLNTGLSQLGQFAQLGIQRRNLKEADAIRAQAFREMFPNFGDDLLTTN